MKTVKINKKIGLILFCAFLSMFGKAETHKKPVRPNVIVIMADQWRYQAIGHYGDPNVKTPNLDKLAREAVDFTNAVAEIPVCTPARAAFMTGQRPLTNGVFMNDVQLDTNAVSIAKTFKKAGYATAAIGKWHIDGNGRSAFIPKGNRRQGFEYWKVLECTHDYNNSYYYADTPDTLKWEGYDAFAQTADAINYMKSQIGAENPFFMFLSWGPPHDPYQTAPEEYRALYNPNDIILRPNVPERIHRPIRKALAGYYAHCTALDEKVGDIMFFLEKSGLSKNTIVLFLSDHGDMVGSQWASNKQRPYDESIRIPMMFKLPASYKAIPGTLDMPIGIEDVMPTLLGLCGIKVPKTVDGQNYTPYILGKKQPKEVYKMIYCIQPYGQWSRERGGKEYRGIRTTRYTYVKDLNGPWLFFDNETDPYQLNNLVEEANYKDLIAQYDARLTQMLKANQDKFLPGLEYVKQYNYPSLDKTETIPFEW